MKKGLIPLILLAGIVIIAGVLWFTGTYDKLFSPGGESRVGNTLALDLEQLQVTIRTVSSPVIEELEFIEAIDTLSANESIAKLRNPFVKVYVAPPPSEKPKAKTTSKKKKTVRKKKRIVRPKVALTGIIWDLSNPYAILNNDIYAEGDYIKGYTVQTIQDTMVVLVNNDDIFSIVLVRE
jgi:hypothetical protein